MTKKHLSVASTLIYIKSDLINILRYVVSLDQRNNGSYQYSSSLSIAVL